MPSIVIEAPERVLDVLEDEFGAYHRLEDFILLDSEFGDVVWFMDNNDLEVRAFRADLTVDVRSG